MKKEPVKNKLEGDEKLWPRKFTPKPLTWRKK